MKKFPKLKLCLAHFGGGSSDWKTWWKDSERKASKALAEKKLQHRNSNTTLTVEEKDALIAEWYMELRNLNQSEDKDSPNAVKTRNWIREIVEMMETYDNFYTDISYHYIEDHKDQLTWLLKHHPHVKNRIMFGTDWYMTALENKSIGKFVTNAKKALDEISDELEQQTGVKDDLWVRFSRLNPMAFYGFRGIAENFVIGLKAAVPLLKEMPEAKAVDQKKAEKQIEINDSMLKNNLEIIKRSDLY